MYSNLSHLFSISDNFDGLNIEYIKEKLAENDTFTIVEIRDLDESEYTNKKNLKEIYLKLHYLPFIFEEEDDSLLGSYPEKEDILEFYVAIIESSELRYTLKETFTISGLEDKDIEEIFKIKNALSLATEYKNFAILDYQRHIKLLSLLSISPLIFIDISTFVVRSGSCLEYISRFDLPPSLDYLYSIHGGYNEKTSTKEYWLHTHGLSRISLPELEIPAVNDSEILYSLSMLLSSLAKRSIEFGGIEKNKVIEVMGISLTLTDFAEYKKNKVFSNIELHKKNSLAVVPYIDGNICTFDIYKEIMTENNIFSLSSFETNLIRDCARATIGYFFDIFDNHKDDAEFKFLIKLAYAKDEDSYAEGEIEHLWFEVSNFYEDDFEIEGTLLNEPYYDLGMHEGDVSRHEIIRLTDWKLSIKDNSYNSSNLYLLFEDDD